MSKAKDLAQDRAVIIAEANGPLSDVEAGRVLAKVRRIGGRLHAIYERQCNGYPDARGNWDEAAQRADEEQEILLERELRLTLDRLGLGLYLNTDPRGNPVGILTPKTGRYNTMGGAECGWRL